MKLRNILLSSCVLALSVSAYAQDHVAKKAQAPENWFNLDYATDSVRGVSSEKAYKELLKDKKSTTIIVSIIDSGMDEEHEDLHEVMWINKGETPDNGIDDDGNGYIDDINGWNFIGGKDGKNIDQDALELTRVYVYLRDKRRNKKENKRYQDIKSAFDEAVNGNRKKIKLYQTLISTFQNLSEVLGTKKFTTKQVNDFKVDEKDEKATDAILLFNTMVLPKLQANGLTEEDTIHTESLINQFNGALDYFSTQNEYYYNPNFDPRKEIVGDDYMNPKDRIYGNNDVTGPDALHGTHVGGIVGAKRNNNIGMNGVANNVLLMSVRAVPNGDERDKDVANAIRYSVDNGAKIINMSFGKGYSFDKKTVDAAVKYAQKKGVLLVHAAGNSNLDTDINPNFPNKYCKNNHKAKPFYNWIEVGALSWEQGPKAAATFSNYGAQNVDLFAPGVSIYSTLPNNEYAPLRGTSMASPVVAGVAALVWSYYPELTVKQLRQILIESTVKIEGNVNIPGSGGTKQVEFKKLCNTGGVVNAYNALLMAEKIVGKKK